MAGRKFWTSSRISSFSFSTSLFNNCVISLPSLLITSCRTKTTEFRQQRIQAVGEQSDSSYENGPRACTIAKGTAQAHGALLSGTHLHVVDGGNHRLNRVWHATKVLSEEAEIHTRIRCCLLRTAARLQSEKKDLECRPDMPKRSSHRTKVWSLHLPISLTLSDLTNDVAPSQTRVLHSSCTSGRGVTSQRLHRRGCKISSCHRLFYRVACFTAPTL